jgi:hypothetical protein
MMTRKLPARVGDTVTVYYKKYIKFSRCPSNPNGRYNYRFRGTAVLLSKYHNRAWQHDTTYKNATAEEIRTFFDSHVALQNSTQGVVDGDVTVKNNPVLFPDGEVSWVDADQINR